MRKLIVSLALLLALATVAEAGHRRGRGLLGRLFHGHGLLHRVLGAGGQCR